MKILAVILTALIITLACQCTPDPPLVDCSWDPSPDVCRCDSNSPHKTCL